MIVYFVLISHVLVEISNDVYMCSIFGFML